MMTSSGDEVPRERSENGDGPSLGWSLLSHHVHVLLCIAKDPDLRIREIAAAIGLTERATHRLVDQLVTAGALTRRREGRRNHYEIDREWSPDHPLERGTTLGQLLMTMSG